VNTRVDALAALFENDDRLSEAVTELARIGVLRSAMAIGVRSSRRLDALAERNGTERIESAVRHTGVFAELQRVTGARETVSPDAFGNDLIGRGVGPERARYFVDRLDDDHALLVLEAGAVDESRVSVLAAHGADFGLANGGGVTEIIPLRREVLEVSKRVVVTAEVTVRTEIVAERRVIELDLERAEFVIEKRDPRDPTAPPVITRIALRHEEASIVKTTVVTGEVSVRTEMAVDTSRIEEIVKHEILRVDDSRTGVS